MRDLYLSTNIYFRKSDKMIYFVYFKFHQLSNDIHLMIHVILIKMAVFCKICDDFCNVERYPTVIWTCQYSTSALKKTFKILTQEFHLAWQNKDRLYRVFFHMKQRWFVSEMWKSWVKGHHCYNYKYTIRKERKRLSEPENQHSEHSTSVDSNKIDCTSGNMRAYWWKWDYLHLALV